VKGDGDGRVRKALPRPELGERVGVRGNKGKQDKEP
jgi:hypothetical protein